MDIIKYFTNFIQYNEKFYKKREFSSLLEIKDNWPKFVLTLDEGISGNIEGIVWKNISDFLLEDI